MPQSDLFPELPDYDPEPADGVCVGESPVPGLTLKRILRGHTNSINRIAWSPNGRFLVSPSEDGTIINWDIETGNIRSIISNHIDARPVAWSPDSQFLATTTDECQILLKNVSTGKVVRALEVPDKVVYDLAWAPDGKKLAGITSNFIVFIWNTELDKIIQTLKGHSNEIHNMTWSPNSQKIATASYDSSIKLWDVNSGNLLQSLKGHDKLTYYCVAWSPDGKFIAAGSSDSRLRVWDPSTEHPIVVLEGNKDSVSSVSFSPDASTLASKSMSGDVILWRCNTWEIVATIEGSGSNWSIPNLAFHPKYPILATLTGEDCIICIWEIDINILLNQIATKSIRYTTAKLALVGDSGIGKTGLGWRLAHNNFKEHASTHGQQFWIINELCQTRDDGTECEAVLWDLAGQPDYRLVHSLFLDDVDAALVLFDPTNRQKPLSGVDFWLNQLKQKDQDLCNSILIGARTDRGTSTLTDEELQAYCDRNNIQGGYISTSARTGEGIPELLEQLQEQIPWDEMTATVTTQTFKRSIKEYVLGLKEQTDRQAVLVHPDELRIQLQESDPDWDFSDAEMMTAVGHLANHGYVTVLQGSQGNQSILLAPDLLANLASSIVLEARRNLRGLGVLEENRLLAGEYHFPELHALAQEECKTLLDAAAVLFLDHNLYFRETFNHQTFLVFPSLINEKRPRDESLNTIEGASYSVKGAVENIYASLVVLLGYTNTFIRTNQWQNQAQYEVGEGEICGFQQTNNQDGEIELLLYHGEQTPEPVKLMFRGMFERFLSRRDLEISRYQPVICTEPSCGAQLARNVVIAQLNRGRDFSFCNECGTRLSLPSPQPLTRLSQKDEKELDIQQTVAERRTNFETALVRVKGLLRDRGETEKPTCFISYAWGISEHERWVLQLAKDLRNADINVLLALWHSPPGSDLGRYIDRILESEFVIVVGTPNLRKKYDSEKSDPVVAAELELINLRIRQPKEYGHTVLPLLVDGGSKTSLTPQLQKLVKIDFRDSEFYFRKLFDTIWRIYNLPFDNPILEELQASMSPRSEQII